MVQTLNNALQEQGAQENAYDPPNSPGSDIENLHHTEINALAMSSTIGIRCDWDSSARKILYDTIQPPLQRRIGLQPLGGIQSSG